jgi:hypothetical protein
VKTENMNSDIFMEKYKNAIINGIDDKIKTLKKRDFIDIINEIDSCGGIDEKYYKVSNKLIRDIKVKDYKSMIKINAINFIDNVIRELINCISYRVDSDYNPIDIEQIDIDKLIVEFVDLYVYNTYSDMIFREFNDYSSMYYDLSFFWDPDNMFDDFYDNIFDSDIYYDDIDNKKEKENLNDNDILNIIINKFDDASIEIYDKYSEPGYDIDKPILLGDWNNINDNFYMDYLESHYNIEWIDEWISCSFCGSLIRQKPDSYSWKGYFIIDDCEIICGDCILKEPNDYIKSLINNPDKVNIFDDLDLSKYGFENINGIFENGLFEYMNDNPEEILKEYIDKKPNYEFIFNKFECGQFYVTFQIWARKRE